MRRGMEFLTPLVLMVMVLVVGTPAMASPTDGWQLGLGAFLPTMEKYARAIEMYGAPETGNGWDMGWKVSLDLNTEEPLATLGPISLNHAQAGYTSFHDDRVSGSLPVVFVGHRWDLTGGYLPPSRLHLTLDGGVGRPRIGGSAKVNLAWRASADYELTDRLVVFLEHQASQPVRGRVIGLKVNLPLNS